MTSKIEIFCQILAIWEGDFDQFQGQKPVFCKCFARAARDHALSVCASEASTKGSRAAWAQPKGERSKRAKQVSPYEREWTLPNTNLLLWGPADALKTEKSAGFWFHYSSADVRPNASKVLLQFKNAMVGTFKILTHFDMCLVSPVLNEKKKYNYNTHL